MPLSLHASNSTEVRGTNVWVVDGNRQICITYVYSPSNGQIQYAASVFRKDEDPSYVLTVRDIDNHEHTTARRFNLRPVQTEIEPFLEGMEIIQAIRHEMCHGAGCKGIRLPRQGVRFNDGGDDGESVSSGDSFLSTNSNEEFRVGAKAHRAKTIRHLRFIEDDPTDGITRNIFIAFKGSKSNGDALYGACISRTPIGSDLLGDEEVESHYGTAESRLTKCPVHIKIPDDVRHQLGSKVSHREDLLYCFVDKIFERRGGCLQIKGGRL